jgi:hypothetical protein
MTAKRVGALVRSAAATAALIGLAPAWSWAGLMDFRSTSFAAADHATSFLQTNDGVTVAFTPGPQGAKLYWDNVDGLGVRWSYETDEIESAEWLTISFSAPVELHYILLTDLFKEGGYLEKGWYQLDDDAPVWFVADPGQVLGSSNGLKELNLNRWISSIRLGAPGYIGQQNHEFSVASVEYSPTPEPGSAALFGPGGLVVGWAVRRKRSVA